MKTSFDKIDDAACDAYRDLGAVCLRGAFIDLVKTCLHSLSRVELEEIAV